MTKKLLALLAATVFTLSLAAPALSAGMGGDVKGTVTKIEGSKVTVKDSMGTEQTIEAKGPDELKDIKVGDQVAVKDGKLTKEGGAGPSSPSPGPKY
jgi:ribosomal protein S1